eukprot:PLAT2930.1.p2 GENE.PLAT2930.1~~PLAT2930.1.p2  ORF type:complete len:313 (+),score=116.90 PLAT2930.1:36-941(+)
MAAEGVKSRKLSCLLPKGWRSKVDAWLATDTPAFDYGGYIVGDDIREASLLGKSAGVLAGVPFFTAVFEKLGCTVEWLLEEGAVIESPPQVVATVRGPTRAVLAGERTALNIITRASGIASSARELAELSAALGWAGTVAGTRKTTPGFRLVEKYALLVGGVDTHRMDLSSMIMLKDNHIWAAGSITEAVHAARSVGGFALKIDVEARTEAEAREAAEAGADIVMLDNFPPDELHAAAASLKSDFPHLLLEASGGITKDKLEAYAGEHIDVISMGSLTQGYKALDFSLKIKRDGVPITSRT